MGQFGNQPDFATTGNNLTTLPTALLAPSAVYIGAFTVSANPASITVWLAGDTKDTEFNGLNEGTFLPIVVTKVVRSENIPAANIVLYR